MKHKKRNVIIGGIAKAGDIQKYGLFRATEIYEENYGKEK